jgi:hypothetical protein
MIEVRYNGRLGNRLFMYAAGRIIAEDMGYELRAEPIEGFEGTKELVRGDCHHRPVQMLLPRDHPKVANIVADKSRRKIVLKSYMQDYEHIKERAEDVRRWFRLPSGIKADGDSVLIHVRLGDLATLGWAPSMTYFTDVIDHNFSGRKIVVATDEPGSRHLSALDKYNPTYAEGDHLEHFRLLTTASNLIIGTSTFSWWAAFLSEAIVFAPLMKRGYYSFKPFKNENYVVDESRYNYIENVESII